MGGNADPGTTTRVGALAIGSGFGCEVRTDHTLWCWGANKGGQVAQGSTTPQNYDSPIQVGALTGWTTVAAGGGHACALRDDGTLWCWGTNAFGQLGIGTMLASFSPTQVTGGTTWSSISVRDNTTCAVGTDSSLWCWGENTYGQIGDGTTTSRANPVQIAGTWTQVTTSGDHTCALQGDGSAWCWGEDREGQLGDGGTTASLVPLRVPGAASWLAISAGADCEGTCHAFTCAIDASHLLSCWGATPLALSGTSAGPVQVGSATWSQVSAGPMLVCALRDDQSLWCAGFNRFGRLGTGSTASSANALAQVCGSWKTVSTGEDNTCAIRADDSAWCSGSDLQGELGDGLEGTKWAPTPIADTGPWANVSVGNIYACGVHTDGTLGCWGATGSWGGGQWPAPVHIGTVATWARVAAANGPTCATRNDGTLWCWGILPFGSSALTMPVQMDSATNWNDTATNVSSACGARADGTLWCWGMGTLGELGLGATTSVTAPMQVGTSTAWTASLTCTYFHCCALRTDGSAWCWGDNNAGELGDGTTTNRSVPTQEVTHGSWKQIGTGGGSTCAVSTLGQLWCWGTTPTLFDAATDWRQVVVSGASSACAIKTNGTLWCWGADNEGQLGFGDGTTTASAPTQVGTATDWQMISAGEDNVCGLHATGEVDCWGWGDWGVIGDGSAWRYVPVAVK